MSLSEKRIDKILAMVERGTFGERQSAINILQRLIQEEKINKSILPIYQYSFKFQNKYELKLFIQICLKIMNVKRVDYLRSTKDKNRIVIELFEYQKHQIKNIFNELVVELRKNLKLTFDNFIENIDIKT